MRCEDANSMSRRLEDKREFCRLVVHTSSSYHRDRRPVTTHPSLR
jgi:hypothetical protein